jgi:hypothetical protein
MSSQENQIIPGTDFTAKSQIVYAKAKMNKSGGKSVNVNNSKTAQTLHLSSPLMLTWGVNENQWDENGPKTYDMSLQFPKDGYETTQSTKFLEALQEFENKIKDDAIVNSKDWMNKSKLTPEVVDALFSPMLKYPKDPSTGEPDETRPPTLRVKLDFWDNSFNCEIYNMKQDRLFPNEENSMVPSELITKGANVAVVLRCGGIWFANGKFGVTWRLVQAVVKPRDNMKGRCLIQLSSEEKNVLESQTSEDDADDAVGVVVAEDSDEEEEIVMGGSAQKPSFFEEEPLQKKAVVKKKVVRRKKTSAESEAEA